MDCRNACLLYTSDSIKYKYMLEKISEINPIDEENGIVDIDYIKRKDVYKRQVYMAQAAAISAIMMNTMEKAPH